MLREEKVKEPGVQKPETKQETEVSKPEIESGKKKRTRTTQVRRRKAHRRSRSA